jgi:cytochrome c oxidase cbb3-type subunit 3
MKKSITPYFRVLVLFFLSFAIIEYFIDSGEVYAFTKYPVILAFLGVILLALVAIEVILVAVERIMLASLSEEAKLRYIENEAQRSTFSWFKNIYKKLLGSKPIEKEYEIILDHNYDGIKELDNALPPWWVYMFYATILFAVVYMAKYHVFGGDTQQQEYEKAVAQATLEIEAYKKNAKDLVDVNTVQLLTESADLTEGKSIFNANCVACHMADGGGGIGPNLTDAYWISGGDIKSVFKTVSEGGRAGKGMIPWKTVLKPLEMAQVSSYILSLNGTTPLNPKPAEGDLWEAIAGSTKLVIEADLKDLNDQIE